jgi:PKD domain
LRAAPGARSIAGMLRIPLLALVATLALIAPAQAAPSWLDEEAPFGAGPALQFDADAAMAPDGTVVAVRFTPDDGDLEVSERPPGGPAGAPITLPRVLGAPRPGENLQVLTGPDGTAAVVFEAGNFRWASLRRPGGSWSDFEIVALRGATSTLAPDGALWTATRSPAHANANALWVSHLTREGDFDVAELPVPPDGVVDQAPAIVAPTAGHAHVVFVEAQATNVGEGCEKLSRIVAIDVAGATAGEPRPLDVFAATGEGVPCELTRGAIALRPQLVTSDDGSDTVAYAVQTFEDERTAVLSRHREAGGDWGAIERLDGDPQAVVEQLIGGKGAPVMTIREPGGLVDVTARRQGGGWDQGQLLAASAFPVEGVRTGTGSAVFAWTGGARVRGAVLEPDGTLGNTVAIATAQDLLGVGADAQGDAVVLYSRPAPNSFALRTAGFDAAPPRIGEVGIPPIGRAGEGLPFIVDADDVWGPIAATWDFGDGTREQAIATGHDFTAPGERTVTVTVADAAGNAATASGKVSIGTALQPVRPTTPPAKRDTRAPRLSKLVVRGRRLTLRADESGTLTLKLSRRGHRARMLGRTIAAGSGHVTLPRLAAGTWTATLSLTDAAGNRSRPARVTVRVKPTRTPPRGKRGA